ncbi:MAG: mycofactocin biosynthesis peptidyl-dipeptidase MftE [Microthrixaceae bacterium]|nr:mycofactocin biosynthesis peptidyl-dipeptidase MftE [Microthrixaceae bacterium]
MARPDRRAARSQPGSTQLRAGRPRRLADATWTDLAGREPLLLAVPVGSCEQHGPHLPLDTDTRIATALADQLARDLEVAVAAPPIGIGASGEHGAFPGTLSIGTDALISSLVELARSALPTVSGDTGPFRAVLFVNGHGGNTAAIATAVSQLRSESRRVAAWHPRADGGDLHAGTTETSLMLHLNPELVRTEALEAGATERLEEIRDELTSGRLALVSPNGVLGDPRTASAERGERLFTEMNGTLLAAAEQLLSREIAGHHRVDHDS